MVLISLCSPLDPFFLRFLTVQQLVNLLPKKCQVALESRVYVLAYEDKRAKAENNEMNIEHLNHENVRISRLTDWKLGIPNINSLRSFISNGRTFDVQMKKE